MDLQTIIFISRSGGGKGTQVKKLIEYLNNNSDKEAHSFGTGNRIREFLDSSSYSSQLAKKINDTGGLQPAFVSVWSWSGDLIKNLKDNEHLIIDGAPRRLIEAHLLDEAMDFFNRENVKVIYINISEDVARQRLLDRGRSDDDTDTEIQLKMDWFNRDVLPVIDYYKSHDKFDFYEVNGEQSVDDVHGDVVKLLV